ncbi:MAG: LEA type 2 family protein [Halobacteriales archaeon]
MATKATALKAVAAVLILLILAVGAVGAFALTGGFAEPTVESVDVRWGEVTNSTSEIRATVVVSNPNPIGIPGVLDIEYKASLNGVAVGEGVAENIGLSTGQDEIELVIPVDNQKIPAWWVTHVNNGEQSTLGIEATVKGPFGVSFDLPRQERSFQTAILAPLESEGGRELSLLGQPLLTLGERTAEWGEANEDTTPIAVSTEVTNNHEADISFDGVGYVVTMNGITMGEGEDMTEFTVAPGETDTLVINTDLETQAFDDWWVSHLNADETTSLSVETYLIVDGGENDPTVELDLVELGLDLQTDLLGGGGASTTNSTTTVGGDLDYELPAIELRNLAWGEVTDAETQLEATLAIDNPNADSPLNELVDLTLQQTVAINDVTVADETSRIEDVPEGATSRSLQLGLDNTKVPQWWAAHINNGETSTISIASTGKVDAGVTTFDLELPSREETFSTDLLADMNSQRSQTLNFDGEPAVTVVSTSAAWGEANPQETPLNAEIELRNERDRVDVTVSDVAYTMTMNNVTVADGTDPASVTIAPGQTDTLAFTMVIDSQKMDEWWISHIQNGETTTLSVEITATIEIQGQTESVTIDLLGGDSTVTTDILGSA